MRHANRLTEVLEQAPDVLATITDTIARQDKRGGAPSTSGGSAGSDAPLNLDASQRRDDLQYALCHYARAIAEHDTEDLSTVQPAFYLRMSMHIIRQQEYAGDMLHNISRALHRARAATDTPADTLVVGSCGAHIDGTACTEPIRARQGDSTSTCRACGHVHDVDEIQEQRTAEAWSSLGTLGNVVRALRKAGQSINPKSAQRWAREGHLTPKDHTKAGVALYSPAQLIETSKHMKSRHGGSRKRAA